MATQWPIASASVLELVIHAVATGVASDKKDVVNILHWSYNGIPDPTLPPNLSSQLADIHTSIAVNWGLCKPVGYVVDAVSLRWMNDPTFGIVFDSNPGGWSGTLGSADWEPTNAAVFVEKVVPWRYKGSRPGLHLSPVMEGHTDDYKLSTAGLTAYQNLCDALNDSTTGATAGDAYAPWLHSRKLSVVDPTTGLLDCVGCPITDFRLRKTLGSMRSRTVRGRY